MPGVVICVENSIIVKYSDKFPCGKLEQSGSVCEKLCIVPEGLLGFTIGIFLSLLNSFYSNSQRTVTSWFANIKEAVRYHRQWIEYKRRPRQIEHFSIIVLLHYYSLGSIIEPYDIEKETIQFTKFGKYNWMYKPCYCVMAINPLMWKSAIRLERLHNGVRMLAAATDETMRKFWYSGLFE